MKRLVNENHPVNCMNIPLLLPVRNFILYFSSVTLYVNLSNITYPWIWKFMKFQKKESKKLKYLFLCM